MCGDGSNDCIGLKSADLGVSLSTTESSVAAPFTSRIQDITCIPLLLKEGRSALAASFQIFKYVGLYAMIQFMQVVILYQIGSYPTNLQFLMEDLGITLVLAFLMGATPPY
jgi:cation-transporting ATPase 13A3/4/5